MNCQVPGTLPGIWCLVCVYPCTKLFLFSGILLLSSSGRGSFHLFSRSRLRGTQAARNSTTAQVWVPAGLRGVLWAFKVAYSGQVTNRGEGIWPNRAKQALENPDLSLFHQSVAVIVKGKGSPGGLVGGSTYILGSILWARFSSGALVGTSHKK